MKISTASLTTFLIILILFMFTNVSCAGHSVDSLKKDSQKYLSFYENVDGEKIHWEANFLGDEITSIYKNGKRIPDELVDDYKYKVYDQLDEMRFGSRTFSFRMPVLLGEDFHLDMDELHKNLDELREKLKDQKLHLKEFKLDEDLKKQMEELKKELKENKSKSYKFNFDDKKFKEEMEKLEKELQEKLRGLENYKFQFEWEEEDTEA
jgi:hypothetical protein